MQKNFGNQVRIFVIHLEFYLHHIKNMILAGVILELSDREKFCDNFRISRRSFGPNLDFPIHSIHFHFSLSSILGEVSQLRETFSCKSPSRMTPILVTLRNE